MKRKLFTAALLCGLALLLTAGAALAAASGTCGDALTWTLDDKGTLTVSGTGAMDDVMGFTAPWCEASPCITRVVIESGVTRIGNCAFYGQTELLSVSAAASVTEVGESAFLSCSKLTRASFPGVKKVEDLAFAFTGLTTLCLGKNAETLSSLAFACSPVEDVYYGDTDSAWSSKGLSAAFDPAPTLHTGWKTGWYKDSVTKKWFWFKADGTLVTGWKRLSGKWYYLDAVKDGAMVTGWKKVSGKWYYLDPSSGAMVTGWKKVSGKWYYLDPASGAMVTGWKKLSGKWYYLDPTSGAMKTGLQTIGGKTYYLDKKSGAMKTDCDIDGWHFDKWGAGTKIG